MLQKDFGKVLVALKARKSLIVETIWNTNNGLYRVT